MQHTGQHIGYARVSSLDQSLDMQLDRLRLCDRVYQEKRSGTTDDRPQLQACLDYVRDGDTLIITRLDRLARNTLHLCQIADTLAKKGVALRVLDQQLDTSTSTGKLTFHLIAVIAEFENDLRRERQAEGIARARARGVHLGRRKDLTPDEQRSLCAKRAAGVLIRELMHEYGISKASVYRYLAAPPPPVQQNECAHVHIWQDQGLNLSFDRS